MVGIPLMEMIFIVTVMTSGFYCPATTDANPLLQPKACPVSTYGALVGLYDINQCTTCDAGSYCVSVGASHGDIIRKVCVAIVFNFTSFSDVQRYDGSKLKIYGSAVKINPVCLFLFCYFIFVYIPNFSYLSKVNSTNGQKISKSTIQLSR